MPDEEAATRTTTDEQELLVAYLRERSVPCPACGYDLRNLALARCPECRLPLRLAVAGPPPSIVRLVVAAAPGMFSGVCAGILGTIAVAESFRGGPPPVVAVIVMVFGALSGIAMVALVATARRRFLAWTASRQLAAIIAIWLVHVAMFAFMWVAL